MRQSLPLSVTSSIQYWIFASEKRALKLSNIEQLNVEQWQCVQCISIAYSASNIYNLISIPFIADLFSVDFFFSYIIWNFFYSVEMLQLVFKQADVTCTHTENGNDEQKWKWKKTRENVSPFVYVSIVIVFGVVVVVVG